MHIITQKRIWEAIRLHPNLNSALEGWYRVAKKNSFKNYAELKKTFNTIDKVQDLYVFDVGGNKLRLIANICFQKQRIYIRNILTHKEYDKGLWKR